MSNPLSKKVSPETFGDLRRIAELLGGQPVLKRIPNNALDVHEFIVRGLPAQAFLTLVKGLVSLPRTSAEKTIGVSMRTVQRRQIKRQKLSREQSARIWKFAEILLQATEVFGSQKEAEEWLRRPAIGLEQRRPIDLLSTPAGLELVETYLQRLAYGVYT